MIEHALLPSLKEQNVAKANAGRLATIQSSAESSQGCQPVTADSECPDQNQHEPEICAAATASRLSLNRCYSESILAALPWLALP